MKKNKKNNFVKNKKTLAFLLFILFVAAIQLPIRKIISQKIADRAGYYFNGGEYDLKKAEKLYDTALKFDQNNWTAHYQLGRIDLINSHFKDGVAEMDKALAVNPENKRAYYVRGLLDGYAHNYAEAEKDFQNFIAWAPKEWAGYVDLSWVYINSQKYADAITTTNNALVIFPKNAWLYANKGLAEYKAEKYDEAKTDLGIARKLAKNLTPEDWARAYPGNNSADAEAGVAEIRKAIDYNLKLAYEATGNNDSMDDINVNLADLGGLSKYAGNNNLYDGVALSACGSSSVGICNGSSCGQTACIECDSGFDWGVQYNGHYWDAVDGWWIAVTTPCCIGSGQFCSNYDADAKFCNGWQPVDSPLNGAKTCSSNLQCSTCSCDPNIAATVCSGTNFSDSCGNTLTCPGTKNCPVQLTVNIDQGDCDVGHGEVSSGFGWNTTNFTQTYSRYIWTNIYTQTVGCGCQFDHWEGTSCSGPNCGLSMIGDYTITAHFKKIAVGFTAAPNSVDYNGTSALTWTPPANADWCWGWNNGNFPTGDPNDWPGYDPAIIPKPATSPGWYLDSSAGSHSLSTTNLINSRKYGIECGISKIGVQTCYQEVQVDVKPQIPTSKVLTVNVSPYDMGWVRGGGYKINCGGKADLSLSKPNPNVLECSETVNTGGAFSMNIHPSVQANFIGWSGCTNVPSPYVCDVTMDIDKTVTANFQCTPKTPSVCAGTEEPYKSDKANTCKNETFPDDCKNYVCQGDKDCSGWSEVGQ